MLEGLVTFPDVVWCLISEKCDDQTFLVLETALPELRWILPSARKIKILLKDVLGIMYRKGFLDFGDISRLKLVCVDYYKAIRALFSEVVLDSIENRNMEKLRTSVIIWLPLRHLDRERLFDMSTVIENGTRRCPAPSGTLIVRYPRYKKDECLTLVETRNFLDSIEDLLKLFTSLEIEQNEEAEKELEDHRGRWTQEYRDLHRAGRIWNTNVLCLSDFSWIRPFFEKMKHLKSINLQEQCLGQCVDEMLRADNFSSLKCITLGRVCECGKVNRRMIANCQESLEVVAINHWKAARRLLHEFSFQNTLELKVRAGALCEAKLFHQLAHLLKKAEFLPSLKRIIVVLDGNSIRKYNMPFARLLESCKKRSQRVQLFKCSSFSSYEDLEEVPV